MRDLFSVVAFFLGFFVGRFRVLSQCPEEIIRFPSGLFIPLEE